MAKRMSELAQGIAGYISHKGFVAEDGERVTSSNSNPKRRCAVQIDREHGKAKAARHREFFSEYKFQICNVIRGRS